MFDIKEYYFNYQYNNSGLGQDISDFEDDVSSAIDSLLNSRMDDLYLRDTYKHQHGKVEIVFPSLSYPKSSSLMLTPDKIRYLLSFYPHKANLENTEKIVLRPHYTSVGDIELISLYLRKKGVLVVYLFHPHFYRIAESDFTGATQNGDVDLSSIKKAYFSGNRSPVSGTSSELYIHPLWYMLSLIERDETDAVDKFFIKRSQMHINLNESLNDISSFFTRNGY